MNHEAGQGKVAVITGASSGIGRATSLRFAREGFLVYAAARRVALLEELRDEFLACKPGANGAIIPAKLDVTSEDDVSGLASKIDADGNHVDVLFNNAGMGKNIGLEETDPGLWNATIAANLTSVYLVTRAFLGLLRRSPTGGIIVNNASVAADRGFVGFSAYAAAKAGVAGFSRVLRNELRPQGVRVTTLVAGATDSDFWIDVEGEWDRSRMMKCETIADIIFSTATLPREAVVEELVVMPSGGAL
jgi:NAD(P)-dependent dehydrogenase (short-subunit alcohol dehydrogenase family)